MQIHLPDKKFKCVKHVTFKYYFVTITKLGIFIFATKFSRINQK